MSKRALWIVLTVLFGSAAVTMHGSGLSQTPGDKPTRPRGRRGHPGGRTQIPALSEQQEAELLAALKDKQPRRYRHLVELRQEKPKIYRRVLGLTWQWYQRWKDLPPAVQDAAVAVQVARFRIRRTLRAFHAARDPQKKAQFHKSLASSVARQFDAQQTLSEHRVQKLKQSIARLEEKLRRQAEGRDKIIRQRVQRYLAAPPPGKFGPPRSRGATRPHGPGRGDRRP